MIQLPKNETKLMVAVHGWSGIVLGLLLYAVVLTGTVAVFAEEIGAWSAGHTTTQSAFERPFADDLRRLGAETPAEYHDDIDLFEIGDHDLGVFFHRHETGPGGEIISRGVFYQLGKDGETVTRQLGTSDDVYGARNDNALSHFLVDTHVQLHLPNPWGLLLTGILGLSMLVAAVSGLLIHRHLFKDIFTLRRKASPVLFNRDRHSVAGTWSLPFAFILAFTGSFFSFFASVGVPIVAMSVFGGDVQALTETVYGNPGTPDPRPAAIGNLDRSAADAIERAGAMPTFATIEHFGRADAKMTTYHPPKEGGLAPISLLYDGVSGEFLQPKPLLGTRPSAGGTLAAIMSPLHFGNFAGLLSKAIWFGLGFATCYVTLTGLRLWLARREGGVRSLAWLDRTVTTVGLGLPFALAGAAVAFLITMPMGTATYWTPAGFLLAAAGVMLAAACWPSGAGFSRAVQLATGGAMLCLAPLRLLTGGPGWREAIETAQPVIPALDIAFLLAGGWMIYRMLQPSARHQMKGALSLEAAE